MDQLKEKRLLEKAVQKGVLAAAALEAAYRRQREVPARGEARPLLDHRAEAGAGRPGALGALDDRAHARDRAPRREARQHPLLEARDAQARGPRARLRALAAGRDRSRPRHGDAALHVARAGARTARPRLALGHLLARRDALRAALG